MDKTLELVQLVRGTMQRFLLAIGMSTVMLAGTGCSPSSEQAAAAAPKPLREGAVVAPSVTPASVLPTEIIVSGPVTVEQQLDIVSLRAGVVVGLSADVDSNVQKGQVLALLDDRQLIADRDAAEFKAKSLESDLRNWEAEVDVRASDMRRAEEMRKEGINTQEAYDHTKYDLTAAKYEVDRQRAEMMSAQATLRSLNLELEKTRYIAPFSGIVSERHVRLGQYVAAGDKLFHVTAASPLEVRFTLPGGELKSLKRGDTLAVAATPNFQQSTTATVTHISPVIDPGSNTVEVRAVLSGNAHGLTLGSIASIRIPKAQ